jgi:TetR/AcrR family transcriptional regulator, transcriptional repressor for nem operon
MGRSKSYDRDEVTDRAMQLFWAQGFHATSTRALADAMGVNPYSLYAEFGSKEALFDAALARYEARVVAGHFGALEAEGAGLDEVRAVLEFFGGVALRGVESRGCLSCNTAVEQAPTVEASRSSAARYVDRLCAAFAHALGGARADGRLSQGAPVEELAAFFTTQLIGTFLLLRARVDPEVIRRSMDQALARLEAVTAP